MADYGFSMMKREAKLGRSLFSRLTVAGNCIDEAPPRVQSASTRQIDIKIIVDRFDCRIDTALLLNHNNEAPELPLLLLSKINDTSLFLVSLACQMQDSIFVLFITIFSSISILFFPQNPKLKLMPH